MPAFHVVVLSTMLVASIQPVSARSTAPKLALVEEIRVGSREGQDDALTEVHGILGRRDGSVYVLQRQDRTIRFYDRGGQFVRQIGRLGAGPGEFRLPGAMGLLGDTLWVADAKQRRATLFDSSGRVLTTMPLATPPLKGQYIPRIPEAFLVGGSVLARPSITQTALLAGNLTTAPLLRMSRSGVVLDTVAWLSYAHDLAVAEGPVISNTFRQPFALTTLWASAPDGSTFVIAERDPDRIGRRATFRVTSLNAAGDTIFSRLYPYVPIRITDHVIDSIAAMRSKRTEGRHGGGALPASKIRAALYRPKAFPPFTQVLVGVDTTVWVGRDLRAGPNTHWMVLGRSGELIGEVTTPKNLQVFQGDSRFVWATGHDADDVPYVARYRLVISHRR